VGADRALKRLALLRVEEVPLDPPGGDGAVHVRARDTLRDALSQILLAGREEATVLDEEGNEAGLLTIDAITGMTRAA
jgi:hypothetical protein